MANREFGKQQRKRRLSDEVYQNNDEHTPRHFLRPQFDVIGELSAATVRAGPPFQVFFYSQPATLATHDHLGLFLRLPSLDYVFRRCLSSGILKAHLHYIA